MKPEDNAHFIARTKKGIASRGSDYLQKLCEDLKAYNGKYNWVGVYIVTGDKLVLNSYAGDRTEHEQISIGDGLCSQAIVQNAIVNEADVHSNPTYLACFLNTKSELVVPVRLDGKPVGEIDIDSDTSRAFNVEDERFISEIAEIVADAVGSLAK
ncbi:MAG: GAF domain-containing protein [Thermoplasmataceae archaeon]